METSKRVNLTLEMLEPFCLKLNGCDDINNLNCILSCPSGGYSYQWTVAKYCCYDKYQIYPNCCSSDAYQLLITLFPICFAMVVILPIFVVGCCWYFDMIPGLVRFLTCGVIKMKKKKKRKSRRRSAKTTPDLCSDGDMFSDSTPELDSGENMGQPEVKNFIMLHTIETVGGGCGKEVNGNGQGDSIGIIPEIVEPMSNVNKETGENSEEPKLERITITTTV